jgi:hypothetical protein
LSGQGFVTTNENERNLSRLRATLEAMGNGKCYFPCYDCRGLKKKLLITIAQRHCREKGHTEGGYEYCPLVKGFNI